MGALGGKKESGSVREYRRRVLILDDDENVNALMKACIGEERFAFAQERDGTEALAKIESFKPELVILDVYHPGLDGVEVCRKIKGNPKTRKVPVILLSALDVKDKFFVPWKESPDYYLRKPFEPSVLRALVNRIFTREPAKNDSRELDHLVTQHEFIEEKMKNEAETVIDVYDVLHPSRKKEELSAPQRKEGGSVGTPARVLAVGVGGCGGNIVNRLQRLGVQGCDFLSVQTSTQTEAEKVRCVLIGSSAVHGGGADGSVGLGRKCAEIDNELLIRELADYELVLIFLGVGGGTGTGAAPTIAKIAKGLRATTAIIGVLPFKLERARCFKAHALIRDLRDSADVLILFDNELIMKWVPNLPINEGFVLLEGIIATTVEKLIQSYPPKAGKKKAIT